MSVRSLPSVPSLQHLRHQARDLLKALQSGQAEALARVRESHPKFARADEAHFRSAIFSLSDAQLVVAREYGFANWAKLKEFVEGLSKRNHPAKANSAVTETMIRQFLEYACPDHHIRGGPAHLMARGAAAALLKKHPQIARQNIYPAVICGELTEVRRILAEHPGAVSLKYEGEGPDRAVAGGSEDLFKNNGPKRWDPLLFLCFARLPLPAAVDNSVEMARLLLDHGADPNAYFMAGDSRYTPLVGLMGEGEENRLPHPRRNELVSLLLERGAEPYDSQVIYDIHFRGEVLWFLKLMHEHSVRRGRKADWEDPEWSMLSMGNYGSGARWHLDIALKKNDLELAEWVLTHGASPNAAPARDRRFSQRSLYEEACRAGLREMAKLLVRYGANRTEPGLGGIDAFISACLRLDRSEASRIAEGNPEYLRRSDAMFAAIHTDRPDVVTLLLDLGMSADIADRGLQTALHLAAFHGRARVAEVLIDRGAKIDAADAMHGGTPLWWAIWGQQRSTMDLLNRHSKDLRALTLMGKISRLREIFSTQPELARSASSSPLMHLPSEEPVALEIVKLFLAHGADATIKDQDGQTAAELATKRGLDETAELLRIGLKSLAPTLEVSNDHLDSLAKDLVAAWESGDEGALQRLNKFRGQSSTWDDIRADIWHRVYKVRQAKARPGSFLLADAKEFLTAEAGFGNWGAFVKAGGVLPGEPYVIRGHRISPRRRFSPKDWERLVDVMKERGITSLDAHGQMTDAALRQISELPHVTSLKLGGSQHLTDEGLQHLARMPQLRRLDLSNYPGSGISDRGLEALQHLRELRSLQICWQPGISDVGISNLRFCPNLEDVNLLGTPTGDGALAALAGKQNLRLLRTGKLVTDTGLPLLHEFPVFKTWREGEVKYSLMSPDAEPNHLLLDGPFTDDGLRTLAGLNGLFGLSFFWHVTNMTAAGLGSLADLAQLGFLGCEGKLCNDVAMAHIARIPRLKMLMGQGAVASDQGFVELSRATTLEYFWGRDCPNFTGPGFVALSKLPALRGLAVSCKKVDDASLSLLPEFPALRELMPMDVQDAGFWHIGACEKMERLWCMYCRETTDIATEQIANLRLKQYYAGLTLITDRSLEILSRMNSLEKVEFYECKNITDAGITLLARLPQLRELDLGGLPNVSSAVTTLFPASVKANYSP